MTAIIDDSIAVELNEYFSTKKDDYTRGVIRFPLENLKGGNEPDTLYEPSSKSSKKQCFLGWCRQAQ